MRNTAFLDGLQKATRLTGAGRLMEATAAIQRMLGGGQGASAPAQDTPYTIDGEAEPVTAPDPAPSNRKRPNFRAKVLLKDLVRPHRAPATGAVSVPDGARFDWHTVSVSAGSRRYRLFVPSTYTASRPAPLLVMLHGCTQSPDDFAVGTGMNGAAERASCLVAYPEQTSAANMQKCWNWFNAADQIRDAGEPAIIAGLTQAIMKNFAIDPARVYIAGLSAGGAMAAIMGTAYPDLYAAVGVHSGLASGAAHDMPSAFAAMRQGASGGQIPGQRTIPTIVFHGDEDHTVSPRNGDAVIAQAAGGHKMTAQTQVGGTPGMRTYTRTTLTGPAGDPAMEHWLVNGAPHAWSGGSAEGSYTDPTGPDASAEMLRFFLSRPPNPAAV